MEVVKNLVVHSPLEKKLLETNGDSSLIARYSRTAHLPNADLRIVAIPVNDAHRLPPRPVLLFVHGLGGQLNQFDNQLDYLSHFANVLAVDLPGHGQSPDKPDGNYSTSSAITLLEQLLESHPFEAPVSDEVILVGHSMGCQAILKLAAKYPGRYKACICITPPDAPANLARSQTLLRYLPAAFFNVFRAVDRVGGLESPSVKRVTSPSTTNTKILENRLRTNLQVRTKPWMATVAQWEPFTKEEGAKVDIPVLFISAVDDKMTPPAQTDVLASWLNQGKVEKHNISAASHSVMCERPEIVNGIIGDFLSKKVDPTLSCSWQLSHLAAQSDKWSLKNEQKWSKTLSVGKVVLPSRLRGLKTLRENDKEHSPKQLEKQFPDIVAIIDISRETPVYEPKSFAHIKYHKFPTVSKIPPSRDDVKGFVELVDSIPVNDDQSIAVHCHYGFNRTGFFICSYLIEKCGLSVPDAIKAFKDSRPTGIHHPHFIDELYLRYEKYQTKL